ncbi:MAG: MazG family protein [Gloeomargarita sp. GMQP_bins_120]
MTPLHLLAAAQLADERGTIPLPALIQGIAQPSDLAQVLDHCPPEQWICLWHGESLLFQGERRHLPTQPWPYPLQVYLPDPVRESYRQLVDVVAELRHPQRGCPWDLAQTPQSLTPYILEEAYETVHAIQTGQPAAIQEELGDLLLQVVLQAQIAQETGQFSVVEVAQGLSAKLIRRHPHVFGDVAVTDVQTVRRNWEAIKHQEQGHSLAEKLQHYGETFPPLLAAAKIYQKLKSHHRLPDETTADIKTLQALWERYWQQPNPQTLGQLLFGLVAAAVEHHLDPHLALEHINHAYISHCRSS